MAEGTDRNTPVPLAGAAAEFLELRRIAVTGVSRSARDHSGNAIYVRLRDRGYEVFAVNPNADVVEGDPSFADLASIPGGVDGVVIATHPDRAVATVQQCIDLGVGYVWMHHGPAATSVLPVAVGLGRDHGLRVIDGGCPLMFGPTADLGHRCLRIVLSAMGRLPREV
ncbi:MAG: CoA-binding protein [Actinomycetota bacterium]